MVAGPWHCFTIGKNTDCVQKHRCGKLLKTEFLFLALTKWRQNKAASPSEKKKNLLRNTRVRSSPASRQHKLQPHCIQCLVLPTTPDCSRTCLETAQGKEELQGRAGVTMSCLGCSHRPGPKTILKQQQKLHLDSSTDPCISSLKVQTLAHPILSPALPGSPIHLC